LSYSSTPIRFGLPTGSVDLSALHPTEAVKSRVNNVMVSLRFILILIQDGFDFPKFMLS
jgi:hypothetical protein